MHHLPHLAGLDDLVGSVLPKESKFFATKLSLRLALDVLHVNSLLIDDDVVLLAIKSAWRAVKSADLPYFDEY